MIFILIVSSVVTLSCDSGEYLYSFSSDNSICIKCMEGCLKCCD